MTNENPLLKNQQACFQKPFAVGNERQCKSDFKNTILSTFLDDDPWGESSITVATILMSVLLALIQVNLQFDLQLIG